MKNVSGMGPKDEQLHTKYQKVILGLIDDLHKKKMIKTKGNVSDIEVLDVLNRINLSGQVINKLDHQITPYQLAQIHCRCIKTWIY